MIKFLYDGKYEYAYDISEINTEMFLTRNIETVRKSGKSKVTYYNIPCAFDIETTNINCETPYAFMYCWQFCFIDTVIFGRTWEQLRKLFEFLTDVLSLSASNRLCIYCHNLAFEFQFLWSQIPIDRIFAREQRKIITALSGGIEFRCSYYLSNMSLDKFCENSPSCRHRKLSGTYDYRKIRYPWSKLTYKENKYRYNDVKGLCECIADKLKEDTIATIPLTSTGYVRREARKAVRENPQNIKRLENEALTKEQYIMCKEAFRGGDCHANALYTNTIVENVHSYDMQSAYPGVMLSCKFPGKFKTLSIKNFAKCYRERKHAMLFRAKFYNIEHKQAYGNPYIPTAKCRQIKRGVFDNGRIIYAESLEITLTDIDYQIIEHDYNYDKVEVANCYYAEYDYLPRELRLEIMKYFEAKTKLKGIKGHEYEYMQSKGKINSEYGMMVTDIINNEIVFENGEWINNKPEDIEVEIEKHYKSKKLFLSYQWGVWVTAWTRLRLRKFIWRSGIDYVYCDTDSNKTIGNYDKIVDELNNEIISENEKADIRPWLVYNGKMYMLGIWEKEGEMAIKTLGAKKYITKQKGSSKYVVTVSGMNKKISSEYITRKAKSENISGFELFKIGTIFNRAACRTTSYYNDVSRETMSINGKEFETGSNVAIVDTTYTLGVTEEYEKLFRNLQFIVDK